MGIILKQKFLLLLFRINEVTMKGLRCRHSLHPTSSLTPSLTSTNLTLHANEKLPFFTNFYAKWRTTSFNFSFARTKTARSL